MAYGEGQSIKGYEVVERIGAGSFGAVYRAYQTTVGRDVAVKIILPGFANRPEFIRLFETEAQLVARLEHLHIVPLYDYWRDPEGAYLVMRWLRGGSLKAALAEGPYELSQAVRALDQAAAGLATAHAAGVVHRDVKPSNMLLDEEGNLYLADFGIARVLREVKEKARNGPEIVGSPDYLSPEQARGEPVTPQTDIYGLGATLYEMLAGQHPFPGLSAVERLYKHINDPLPLVENLDPLVRDDVNEVIQQATSKNPRHRFENALEMAAAFRQAAKEGEKSEAALLESLTLREQEILQHLIQGKTNQEIADALFVELSTIKWYFRQIYPKLGVRNRRQAINLARRLNLLVADEEEVAVEGTAITVSLPAPVNPYKGLRAFETADARDYFGRERLVAQLLERLAPPGARGHERGDAAQAGLAARHRFLAIIGPSGSGKSSLVQAGLIPALVRGEVPGSERWFVAQMSPGTRPLDELEVALLRIAANQAGGLRDQLERDRNGLIRAADLILPRDASELVLVIDQFEETFTLTADEGERQRFLDMLSAAATDARSRVRVIITLRADYYDRPLHDPLFGDLVRSHMETVLPLSVGELEQAILRPAEQVGVSCQPGLAATIIDDVLYQPGALPLLQYALTELFEQRPGGELTLEAYRDVGGVTGALARRAEDLYLDQDDAGREAIRQMFLRLVAVDDDQEGLPDTRRRVLLAELRGLSPDETLMEEIVDSFAAYRLLTLDHEPSSRRPTVEVAHEALLREWERLRQWLEDSRDDLNQRRRLQVLAREWLAGEQEAGLLLQSTRLDQFAAWAAGSDLALTADEQAFLATSLAARQDRQAEEEARRQRELETARQLAETERQRAEIQTAAARRLRRRAVYLAAALVVAAVLAIAAVAAGRQATANAQQARQNAEAASTQEALAAERAAAAATAEANALDQRRIAEKERDEAEFARATAVAEADRRALAEAAAIREREGAEAQARLAISRELALAAGDQLEVDPELSVLLAERAVRTTLATDGFALPEAESAVHQAIMNLRQEAQFASSTDPDCNLEIWCSDVAYSLDGSLLAISGPENTAAVLDTVSGQTLATVDGHQSPVIAVALSPDNSLLATAGEDNQALLWELDLAGPGAVLAAPRLALAGHQAAVTDVTFSPDGRQLATASRDRTVKLWDVETGRETLTLSGHESSVRDVAFTPDGTELISASSDQTVRVWDLASGQARLILAGHTDRVTDLALSPDGRLAVTVGWDGFARVWDLANGQELLGVLGDEARVYAATVSPDGRLAATAGTDSVINLWDLDSGEETLRLAGHKGIVHNLAFSPDGRRLASGASDGTVRTWDISRAGNREWHTLDGHTWVMFGVDFSPDGRTLATASWDGAVKIWDVQTGAELGTLVQDEWRQMSVEYSPDGRRLATSAQDDRAVLWDTATGEAFQTFRGHQGPILDVAFSPDGQLLATVGEGAEAPGLINVWNAESGNLVLSWAGHEGSVERVAISPDGRLLATASVDGTAKLWEAATGELVAVLEDHQAPVNSVNFSHDGRLLATAGRDNLARIWALDGANTRPILTLAGHASAVWDAVFAPNDLQVATISFDGSARLWDAASGDLLLTLPGAGNNSREVAFSPDGTYLAVTTGSGLVRLYVLPLEEVLALAGARVIRTMSDQECQRFLHLEGCPAD